MGGSLGIILTFLAAYFAFIAQRNIAFLWLLALLAFLVAGYRVWLSEYRKDAESPTRPKLTGFIQHFSIYSFGEDTEKLSEDGKAIIFVPGYENPLGVEVIIHFRMVNENPVPTTLHNFSLKMTIFGQEGFARHADEWVTDDITEQERRIVWEQNQYRFANNTEAEKRCPNLVTYLRDHEMTQGKALEGGLVFRFPGLKSDDEGKHKEGPKLQLGIQDGWGEIHYIEKWGPKPPPLPRRITPTKFFH